MPITMTPVALQKAKEALKGQPEGTFIRFAAKGGGCSGLSYDLRLDAVFDAQHDIVACESEDVKIVVDKKSYLYVNGTELDYGGEGLNQGFVPKNPKARGNCGCGQSFVV